MAYIAFDWGNDSVDTEVRVYEVGSSDGEK
jgi:hypothetical protein